nr:PhoD-like phosphatase N-terminal domain-containing protein [Chitinophagales bacterium]
MFIRFYIFIVLITAQTKLFSQTPLPSNTTERIALDDALFPFYHGVASGDPTQNSVIIWTRLTTDQPTATLEWQVATDTFMQNVIKSGSVSTSIDLDYSVKVDVTDLQPNTFYFYEFKFDNHYSLRGRTKTLPSGNVDKQRFAVVSCSSFPHGYFNVYQAINQRNDVDAIIHLGDYIYEYGKNEYGNIRIPEPENEILTLADYR